MNKNDSILRKQLLDYYNTPVDGVDCITAPHLQLVINSIRDFDKKHIPSKMDIYELLLEQHGECAFKTKGTLVNIREDEESTGYDLVFFAQDDNGEHYFEFYKGHVKLSPWKTIEYVMEVL